MEEDKNVNEQELTEAQEQMSGAVAIETDPQPAEKPEQMEITDEAVQVAYDASIIQALLDQNRQELARLKALHALTRAGVSIKSGDGRPVGHANQIAAEIRNTRKAIDALVALAAAVKDGEPMREEGSESLVVVERPRSVTPGGTLPDGTPIAP